MPFYAVLCKAVSNLVTLNKCLLTPKRFMVRVQYKVAFAGSKVLLRAPASRPGRACGSADIDTAIRPILTKSNQPQHVRYTAHNPYIDTNFLTNRRKVSK